MERSAHIERQRSFGSGFLQQQAGFLYTFYAARYNHLPGAIEVCSNHSVAFPAHFVANLFYGIVIETKHCCHCRGLLFAGGLHCKRTLVDQSQPIFKGDGSCGCKCRELSKRVACNHIGLKLIPSCDGRDYRMKKNRRLCNLCLAQLLIAAVKHNICNAEAEYFVGFLKIFSCSRVVLIQLFSHSAELCTLSCEYKCFHIILLFMIPLSLITGHLFYNISLFVKFFLQR